MNSKTQIAFSSKNHEGLERFLSSQKQPYSTAMIISDHQVFSLFGESLMQTLEKTGVNLSEPFLFSAGEPYKTLATVENAWTHMHAHGLDRKSLVIAFGGGVVTDLAGFAAACYMRGIAHICLPTTLMGMVDAAIGGKTAVNIPTGKNLVGAFHHPVLIDIAIPYLDQLPNREFHSGLAEVIKYGVIADAKLYHYLESHMEAIVRRDPTVLDKIIRTSCAIKTDIVDKDEKEAGIRAYLNFGHTFAHAIEAITHYTTYLHGEAVSIGMCCAAQLSAELGLVDHHFVQKLTELCRKAELPTQLPHSINLDTFISLMEGDKKSISKKITLIVVEKIGKVERLPNIDPLLIKKALCKMQNHQ